MRSPAPDGFWSFRPAIGAPVSACCRTRTSRRGSSFPPSSAGVCTRRTRPHRCSCWSTARNPTPPTTCTATWARSGAASWRGAARGLEQGSPITAPVSLEVRYWYNANAVSRWFLIPGSMTVIMTLLGTLLTSLVIAREYERGTLEALYATPLTRGQILIGKTLPYFLLAMVSMAVCVLTALLLFHLPLRGSFLALGLVSAVFLG